MYFVENPFCKSQKFTGVRPCLLYERSDMIKSMSSDSYHFRSYFNLPINNETVGYFVSYQEMLKKDYSTVRYFYVYSDD